MTVICATDNESLSLAKNILKELILVGVFHAVNSLILQVLTKFRLPLASSPGPSQPRSLVHTVCACAKYPQFVGEIHKIAYTYRTLVTYTNRACSFHANKGEHDCRKAISCTVSVVKADHVQGGAATNREISISVAALW